MPLRFAATLNRTMKELKLLRVKGLEDYLVS